MNFNEYIPYAKKTITYDSYEKLLFCCTTGLLGEFTEFAEHIEKRSSKPLIISEAGDILWYTAILVDALGISIDTNTVSTYYTLPNCGYKTIGNIQEILKKAVRTHDWIPTEIQKDQLTLLFSDIVYGIQKFCWGYGYNISDVLQQNIEKLADRKERGVIHGGGDER